MKKDIVLENYEFSERTVRIVGEDVMLFNVHPDSDFKRSKKDADEIAITIVTRHNAYPHLREENDTLISNNILLRDMLQMVLWDMENGEAEAQKQGKPRFIERKEKIVAALEQTK